MKRSKVALALIAAVAALIVASGVAVASSWDVVARGSANGPIADKAISAKIKHPHRIAVSFSKGSVQNLTFWYCKGHPSGSWSRMFGAGFHELRHVRGKGFCWVNTTVNGAGHATVEILTHR